MLLQVVYRVDEVPPTIEIGNHHYTLENGIRAFALNDEKGNTYTCYAHGRWKHDIWLCTQVEFPDLIQILACLTNFPILNALHQFCEYDSWEGHYRRPLDKSKWWKTMRLRPRLDQA